MAALNLPCLDNKWGLFVLNSTGGTFDTTAGNFVFEFQGINYTVA
jgi:hypothetical protein